jgi:hypothetical protein
MSEFPVEWHNVAERRSVEGAVRPQRVPESVRGHLNDRAREQLLEPAGVELRVVPEESVRVTLSTDGDCLLRPYWGPFQARERYRLGPDPRTIELSVPDRFEVLDDAVRDGPFDPGVCRLRFQGDPVYLHDVDGAARAPDPAELPDRRYLAYGTSITQGGAASEPHLTYVARTSRALGTDAINLGSGGSAYCEPELAEYVAEREDWDVATLGLSVNMVGADFSIAEFRERVEYFVETVAATGRPVFAITLFPHYRDSEIAPRPDDPDPVLYREALRSAVEAVDRSTLHLVEGRDLLPTSGLSADLIHPGDDGFAAIGSSLAGRIERAVPDVSTVEQP